jgi:hypothetical protein
MLLHFLSAGPSSTREPLAGINLPSRPANLIWSIPVLEATSAEGPRSQAALLDRTYKTCCPLNRLSQFIFDIANVLS